MFAQFNFIQLKSDEIKGLVLRRELCAIGILIEAEMVALGDLTKVKLVHGEEVRSKHRALRYTVIDWHDGWTAVELVELRFNHWLNCGLHYWGPTSLTKADFG